MGNPFNMTRGQAMMLYLLVGSGGSRYVHHPLETVSLRILYQKGNCTTENEAFHPADVIG